MQTLVLEQVWSELRKLSRLVQLVLPMAVVQLLNAFRLIFPVQDASVHVLAKYACQLAVQSV
jgi:hypothetical protein